MFEPLRNADLATLATMLREQNALRYDVVAPGHAIHPAVDVDGKIVLYLEQITPVGVSPDGTPYSEVETLEVSVSDLLHDGLSTRLDIPKRYYLRMLREQPYLLVRNIEVWLNEQAPERGHLLRMFREPGSDRAFGRALLSPRYECIDNFDVLLGVLEGVRTSAPDAEVVGADLTERGMKLRIFAPSLAVNIEQMVGYYAPTVQHTDGRSLPLMFAGLFVENSETGNGAYTIGPRAVVQVCKNGLTRTDDIARRVHLGGRMEEGVINWSVETRRSQVELIRNQARDAVATYMSLDYLEMFRQAMLVAHNIHVGANIARQAIENVTRAGAFTEDEGESILSAFIGQTTRNTALDVANAVTFAAQGWDADRQAHAESTALEAAMTGVTEALGGRR